MAVQEIVRLFFIVCLFEIFFQHHTTKSQQNRQPESVEGGLQVCPFPYR